MVPKGDIAERLAALVKTGLSREVRAPEKAVVVERERSGEAHVEFTLPEGYTCVVWNLSTGLFGFLREDKNTDGVFFLCRGDGRVEAHIVECKKTVDSSKWSIAVQQMRWTLTKLLALAGALGVTLSRVVLYTAFRFDKLSADSSPNPIAARRTIEPRSEESAAETAFNDAARLQSAWEDGKVLLRGVQGELEHHKIELDKATGRGVSTFASAD
jgi:hypothetical protein